jgi:hypothetical protein
MKIRKRIASLLILNPAALCLIVCFCFFSGVFAQETVQEEQGQTEFSPSGESAGPNQNPVTIGGGMWGNQSQGMPANENTQVDGTNTSEAVNSDAENSEGTAVPPGRGGIRRTTTIGGVTREDRGPGGNPDVPFDSRMNLAFLILGLLFAVFFRKRQIQHKKALS